MRSTRSAARSAPELVGQFGADDLAVVVDEQRLEEELVELPA